MKSVWPKRSIPSLDRLACFFIPSIAVIVRLGLGFSKLQDIPVDPDHYIDLAKSLFDGQGFTFEGRPTAYRPPLYPMLITPLVGLFGQGRAFHAVLVLFQATIGGATAYLAMRAASQIEILIRETIVTPARPPVPPSTESSRSFAWIAGMVTALDPVLVSQAPLVMTETLAAFLLTGAVNAVVLGRFRSAGLWFGASALCRPSLLACMTLTVAARLAPIGTTPLKRRIHEAARLLLASAIVMSPWALRNWARFGEPVLTTTHGGYTMALANNPVYYQEVVFGPAGAVWSGPRQQAWMDSIGTDTIGLAEPEADRRMKAKAVQFIRSHPLEFIIACVHRQARFWAIAPSAQVYGIRLRTLCAIWTFPVWVFATLALFDRSTWTWPVIAILAVVAGLALVHLVYWTDIRMRAPIVPTLAILAGMGAASAFRWIKR